MTPGRLTEDIKSVQSHTKSLSKRKQLLWHVVCNVLREHGYGEQVRQMNAILSEIDYLPNHPYVKSNDEKLSSSIEGLRITNE